MGERQLRLLFWRAFDRLDYRLTQTKLWVLDAICGPRPGDGNCSATGAGWRHVAVAGGQGGVFVSLIAYARGAFHAMLNIDQLAAAQRAAEAAAGPANRLQQVVSQLAARGDAARKARACNTGRGCRGASLS
jgi:hypothetical protein